jgi:subtilisin family serine protease
MPLRYALLILATLAAPAAWAASLPILREGEPPPAGPVVRGDALIVRLRPAVAARLGPERARLDPGATLGALGLARVDAAALALGGARFEPMFRGGATASSRGPARGARPLLHDERLAGFYRVSLPPGGSLDEALARFAAVPEVESAEPIPIVAVSGFMPNDSLFSLSTWFYQSSRRDIHAPEAWSLGLGDTSVVIAILDTGVLPYHPDLGGTVAGLTGQIWSNWGERGLTPGNDDDGNGFVDDVAGWDFVAAAVGGPFPAFEDVAVPDPDPNDFASHGTMVAGVAGAITDNVVGVAGTAPVVRLMPLRIGWSTNARPLGLVDMGYVAEAIVYATENGADVINCSFETVSTTALDMAVAAAARAGVYVVFAAGNSGGPHDEALRGDVIAVAALDPSDVVAGFSNLGAYVDVAAPGTAIVSTSVEHATPDSIGQRRPTYGSLNGTSFSTPMVSGAVALFEARRRALGGEKLDPTNLALRLWDTADDISTANPGGSGYGGGRLDVEHLLLDPPVSRAFRAGARSAGPAVLIHERTSVRIAWVSNSRVLVIQDALTGDTLSLTSLPANLGRNLAAADMGVGRGVQLFLGTTNGRMFGFDLHGQPLAGWPYFASGLTQFTAGPALGDLDGDGVLEVACGSGDGNVWAWSADGVLLAGFPVATSASGIAGAVALADVDGVPGDEIVVAAKDGVLHAIRFDGSEPANWPVTIPAPTPTQSPVIAALDDGPGIVVAGGTQLHAIGFDGSVRWNRALGGTAAQEPLLVDFDGDGSHEIVVPLSSPNAVAAFDTSGAVLSARGFPATLPGSVGGPPVAGPVAAGVARGLLLLAGSNLVAISDSAKVLTSFRKPGGAGAAPTLDELDDDGRTEVAAGTGPDSLHYFYDAGAGSWNATVSWPTPRRDFARRGNAIAPLVLPVVDFTPPATIADLVVDSLSLSGAALHWTAPGGDGMVGRAASYQVNLTPFAPEAGRFRAGAVRFDAATPDPARAAQSYRVSGLSPNSAVFAAVRAVDSTGNVAAASNVVRIATPLGPPRRIASASIAPLEQPSRGQVTWQWELAATPPGVRRELSIFDVHGRRIRTFTLPPQETGAQQWDGRDGLQVHVPAGVFFARLVSGSFHAQSRVVLLP